VASVVPSLLPGGVRCGRSPPLLFLLSLYLCEQSSHFSLQRAPEPLMPPPYPTVQNCATPFFFFLSSLRRPRRSTLPSPRCAPLRKVVGSVRLARLAQTFPFLLFLFPPFPPWRGRRQEHSLGTLEPCGGAPSTLFSSCFAESRFVLLFFSPSAVQLPAVVFGRCRDVGACACLHTGPACGQAFFLTARLGPAAFPPAEVAYARSRSFPFFYRAVHSTSISFPFLFFFFAGEVSSPRPSRLRTSVYTSCSVTRAVVPLFPVFGRSPFRMALEIQHREHRAFSSRRQRARQTPVEQVNLVQKLPSTPFQTDSAAIVLQGWGIRRPQAKGSPFILKQKVQSALPPPTVLEGGPGFRGDSSRRLVAGIPTILASLRALKALLFFPCWERRKNLSLPTGVRPE